MIIPANILRAMDPATRAKYDKAGWLPEEALAKQIRWLERDQQKMLVTWLTLQEEAGKLVFDWSRTDRKTTNRKGMPDFRIYSRGRVLLGEMKVDGGKLSVDQIAMIEKFGRSWTKVQIWASAQAGIEATRRFLAFQCGQ